MAKLVLVNNFDDAQGGPSKRTARFRKWFSDLDVVDRNRLESEEFRQSLYAAYDGFVLSGSPHDVTDIEKPQESWMKDQVKLVLECPKPILGICFGHQLLCHAFGAKIDFVRAEVKRPGNATAILTLTKEDPLLPGVAMEGSFAVEESHGQEVVAGTLPHEFENLASPEPEWQRRNAALKESTVQFVRHQSRAIWGTQFHPEAFDGADAGIERYGGELLRTFEQVCARISK